MTVKNIVITKNVFFMFGSREVAAFAFHYESCTGGVVKYVPGYRCRKIATLRSFPPSVSANSHTFITQNILTYVEHRVFKRFSFPGIDIAQILTQRARDKHKGVFMKQAKHGSISALVLLALMTTFAAGCYYDRDDRWGISP